MKKHPEPFPYEDIIHLPHHQSSTRAHMSMMDRAAQFSPFAALTGYESAVQETARLTDQKIELAEEERSIISGRLSRIRDEIAGCPEVSITWFCPDARKEGGSYRRRKDHVVKIDPVEQCLVLACGEDISFSQITELIVPWE